eukprot:TRINITY_DN13117_c0_g1_i1.p1 TRINITY_DN13117_c0_g1~~TRINITY_DN13117_c0_g1_i1.p1  ORF type:complete len:374 (+),score=53.33 TRINITY_DN13117_c0_g1_i1:196-1317(+)
MSRSLLHGGVDHGAPLAPEEYNTLLGLKIGCIALIPALSFCGALAPLLSKKIRKNTIAVSYCNILAGSILLGFGFLHILPDAAESFSEWDESVNHFPVVYAMVMVGFFVVLLIEKLLIMRIEKMAAEKRRAKEMKNIELASPDVAEKLGDEECGNCGECKDVSEKSTASHISQRDLLQRKDKDEVVLDLEASKSHDQHNHDHHDHGHDHAHAFHTHDVPLDNETKSATPYVLTIGLAFHSIFEGLALAFSPSIDAMVLLIIGIGLHKFAEGFAMGSSLVKMDLRLRRALLLVAAFCIVLPIGIAIGLGLGEALDEDALNLTMSLTNSFAVGVFIYIAILGVYVEELAGKNHVIAKIGLALVMCLAMGCLSFLE